MSREFQVRRSVLLTRLNASVDSFLWSEQGQKNRDRILAETNHNEALDKYCFDQIRASREGTTKTRTFHIDQIREFAKELFSMRKVGESPKLRSQNIGDQGRRRCHREGVRAASDGAFVVEPADQDKGGPRPGQGRQAVRAGAPAAGDALLAEAAGRRRWARRRRRRV